MSPHDSVTTAQFSDFGLAPAILAALARMQYTTPTPIQQAAIPLALAGSDIMGSAQTGTGKTAAYAIPAVHFLLNNPESNALVLTPTRELGKQVLDIIQQIMPRKQPLKMAFLIGGESIGKQFVQLRQQPRLIVATPGRLNDHLERGTADLSRTHFLILDETDRMLDMGFSVQLDRILKFIPPQRQTLMFSATLPPNILKLADKYLHQPQRVAIGATTATAANVTQDVVRVADDGKFPELVKQLEARDGTVIVFVKTKFGTERLAKRLNHEAFQADAIHGDLKQSRRDRVITAFRQQKFRVLVATDVVARGLDIPHIAHVINYDLPQVAEDYIHRIGRTARAGASGHSVSFVAPSERHKWHAIEQLLDPNAKPTQDEKAPARPAKRKPWHKAGKKPSSSVVLRDAAGKRRFHGKPKQRAA